MRDHVVRLERLRLYPLQPVMPLPVTPLRKERMIRGREEAATVRGNPNEVTLRYPVREHGSRPVPALLPACPLTRGHLVKGD
jgi:hypothetical protein